MSKYGPLAHHLARSGKSSLTLRFAQIEDILGFRLPRSARLYPAWWSNSAGSHVQAGAWIAEGYQTEQVDLAAERLVFTRHLMSKVAERPEGFAEMKQAAFKQTDRDDQPAVVDETVEGSGKKAGRHPAFGALKGMITLLPDVDYAEPADPEWGKVHED